VVTAPEIYPTIPDLAGKVVLITGASTGIGAAAAVAFGHNKARVAIHYNASENPARQVAEEVRAAGGEAFLVQADVTEPEAAARVVSETVEHFGRLNVLVNNAGGLVSRTPIKEYTDEYVAAVLALNVEQVVRFVREGVSHMRAQGGSIINVSSIAARHGGGPGSVIYAAAKGFISVATRGWAKELVKFHERYSTPEQLAAMQATIPMDRLGTPEDCIGAFLYLASDRLSGYVTGQVMEVNGGQYMP
jgi:3-oxoacyl-[acyl-carrier protein] reductase